MKDKKKLLMILGVVSIVLITIGIGYAFFSYSKNGSTENTISSDSITFLYDEVDQQGNGITITNALPISDTDGKAQTQDFDFRIVSDTSTGISIPYEITLRKKVGSDDIDDIVKVYLAKTTDSSTTIANEEEVELSKYSDLETVTKNGHQEKLLHIDKVPGSNSTYNQGYRLKMWIDDSTDYSEIIVPAKCSDGSNKTEQECTSPNEWIAEHNEYPYNNKTFAVTVNVYANGHAITQQDIENAAGTGITSFSVNNTELTETTTDHYEVELPNGTTSTTINIETENPYTTVTIQKTDSTYENVISMNNGIQKMSTSKTLSLSEGENYFKITIRSEDGVNTEYKYLLITVLEPLTGSYSPDLEPVVLDGLAKMVYDDNTIVETELTEQQLKAIDTSTHTDTLYKTTRTNSGNPTYFFRGKVDNNYVKFGTANNTDLVWRVIRINEDGTVRMILDGRTGGNAVMHGTTQKYNVNFMYYTYSDYSSSSSRGEVQINNWYDTNINSNKVAGGYYFCEQAKVAYSSSFATNSNADMTVYNAEGFIPNFYCNRDNNGYGLVNAKAGLITYEEVVYAGGYLSNNTNYYLYKSFEQWTMSPAGKYNYNSDTTWCLTSDGKLSWCGNSGSHSFRPVINLKANVTATKEVIDGKTYYTVD